MSNTEVHSVNAKSMLAGFSIAVVAPQISEAIAPCPCCSARVPRVFVRGHYQCQSCRSNIDDFYQGEVCEASDERKFR